MTRRTAFDHRLLVDSTEDGYLREGIAFVLEGLDRGEAVVVVDAPDRLQLIASHLGRDGDRVRFEDGMAWWDGPRKTFAAYDRAIRMMLETYPGVRALAHPVWLSDDENREWRRFESYANLYFDGWNYTSLCPYDPERLPQEVCDEARRTHPLLQRDGVVSPSPDFMDPHAFVASCIQRIEGVRYDLSREIDSLSALRDARHAIASWASERGADDDAVDRLVLAVSELLTNGIRHGAGAAEVRGAFADGYVVVDVVDEGTGELDPLAPYRPPAEGATGGLGLWVVGSVCDEVAVSSDGSRTCVRCILAQN